MMLSETRLYHTWEGMKTRCYNKNACNYHNYGGRGIKVCDEWLHNFKAFQEWALSHGYDNTLRIDRIDNDKDYEPSNCRWVTNKENNNNRGDCVYVEFEGETHTLKEWSELYNVNYQLVWARYRRGWSIDKALFTPVATKHRRKS